MNKIVTLVDYGMGNLRSVAKALEQVGATVRLTSSPSGIRKANKCVVPGVGSFGDAMQELKKRRLLEPLKEYLESGKPFLGICLGLQLLFEESEEGGRYLGFGVFKGKVLRFSFTQHRAPSTQHSLKIPHMGWNQVQESGKWKVENGKCPLLKGIPDDSYFYFVHSYYVDPQDKELIAATTPYGKEFTSMVWSGNIFATQFHPEKSQALGLRLLKNFVAYDNPTRN